VAKLAQLGRVEIDLEDAAVVRTLSRIHVWTITREVAVANTRLNIKAPAAVDDRRRAIAAVSSRES